MLHLTRQLYPEVKGVFCDTGLEFPEVKEHVKNTKNIDYFDCILEWLQQPVEGGDG